MRDAVIFDPVSSFKSRPVIICNNSFSIGCVIKGDALISAGGVCYFASAGNIFYISGVAAKDAFINYSEQSSVIGFTCRGSLPESLDSIYKPSPVSVAVGDGVGILTTANEIFERGELDVSSVRILSRIYFDFILEINDTVITPHKVVSSDHADTIRSMIDNNICGGISLDRLSSALDLTKMSIIRIFRDKYGVTPGQYEIRKRAEIAASMLASTNMTLSEISDTLGYANTQHFSNSFVKIHGITPSKYRKKRML